MDAIFLNDLFILLIIVFIRALAPFLIFRWPILGALICLIIADNADVVLLEKFPSTIISESFYHNFDKFFDTYYLLFLWIASRKWKHQFAKNIASILFLWRFIGFFTYEILTLGMHFELHSVRPIFLFAPNIMENFYFFMAIMYRWFRKSVTRKNIIIGLILVAIPKIVQEYVMHYRYMDQTWHFFRDNLLWWLYD